MEYKGKKLTEAEEAILKIAVFFDLFSYPLTAYEVWRYLSLEMEFRDIKSSLDKLIKYSLLSSYQGFYFLPGRQDLLDIRRQRYHFANRKIKRAKKVAALFRLLPTVRFVALSNLIGRHNLRDGSDIDIFIIAKANRIWITRLFCAGLMKIFGQRPTPKNKKDKICLSFYVDDNHLDLSDLVLGQDDHYFHLWLAGLYPLYDAGAYHHRLMQANTWLKKYLPNGDFFLNIQAYRESPHYWLEPKVFIKLWRRSCHYLEYWSKSFQMKIMPESLKGRANKDSRVIIRPGVLKLYLVDRRKEFFQKYLERLQKLKNE